MESYVDQSPDRAVASACGTLTDKLRTAHRHGYMRVSAETDNATGLLISRAIGELAAVTVRPGPPCVVTVGLNALSLGAVIEILDCLVS
jgi:hypothetical protein